MRSKLSLLTTAAALALGLTATASLAEEPKGDAPGAKADITIVTNDTGKAQGGAALDENGDSPGAVNSQGLNDPASPSGGGGSMQGGAQSSDQGGTGVKTSADSEGATNKSTQDPGATGLNQGANTGNVPGGSGDEKSAQGQGANNKTSTY